MFCFFSFVFFFDVLRIYLQSLKGDGSKKHTRNYSLLKLGMLITHISTFKEKPIFKSNFLLLSHKNIKRDNIHIFKNPYLAQIRIFLQMVPLSKKLKRHHRMMSCETK